MVGLIVHVNLESVLLVIAHVDGIELVAITRAVLEILVLDSIVSDTPLGLDLRLELRSGKLHRRVEHPLDDHLVTMLHIIYNHVNN